MKTLLFFHLLVGDVHIGYEYQGIHKPKHNFETVIEKHSHRFVTGLGVHYSYSDGHLEKVPIIKLGFVF